MTYPGMWEQSQQNQITFIICDALMTEIVGLGAVFNVFISKAGGGLVPGVGVKAEIGMGWYSYISTAAEANTVGPVSIAVTAVGAIQQNLEYVVARRTVYAVEFTYTLTDPVMTPIEGAQVWIATDAAVTNIIWSGLTDAFGVARDIDGGLPWLDPGVVFIRAQKSGWTFGIDTEVIT